MDMPPNYNKNIQHQQIRNICTLCSDALFNVLNWSSIYCTVAFWGLISNLFPGVHPFITCPDQGADSVQVPQYEQNRSALPMPLQLLHSWRLHPQSALGHQMASVWLGSVQSIGKLRGLSWCHIMKSCQIWGNSVGASSWHHSVLGCNVNTHSCHSFRAVCTSGRSLLPEHAAGLLII